MGGPPGTDPPSSQSGGSGKMSVGWTPLEVGLVAVGVLLVVLGALVCRLWETQIEKRFQHEMGLTNTSKGVEEWKHPTLDLTSYIYLWNWTNAEGIGSLGYKPQFKQVGPYAYREQHYKVNISWNANGTVSYRMQKFYFFDQQLSGARLSDNITSVNTVVATLSSMSQEWGFWGRRLLSTALTGAKQKIYWTHTADELLFAGFDNPVVKIGSYFSDAKPKFGYFYDINGTISKEVSNMDTGVSDIYQLGRVRFFNYVNSTPSHEGNCSSFTGGLGELWPPHATPDTPLVLFTPDMCRSNRYYYTGEGSHNGIAGYIYASTPETVDNGTLVPENECYCPADGCRPSGFFDLRSCREGAPVLMSQPHMYLTDPLYREAIEGMNPVPEEHKTYMLMEPRTGVPMDVSVKFQMNVNVTQNKHLTAVRDVKDVVVPVFWIDTRASLPESHTSGVKFLLTVISLGPYISAAVIATGAVLIIALIARRYSRMQLCCQPRKYQAPEKIKMNGSALQSTTCTSAKYKLPEAPQLSDIAASSS